MDGLYRLVREAPYARGEVGAGAAEVYLGGFEVDVALEEGTDLAHRHPRVEHQPYDRGVAGVVAGVQGEGEELVHLIFFQEDYALVERLVHRFDGVEVYAGVRGGTGPIEEPPYGGVLAVHGKALAVAFEEIVAELHNGADAHVLDPANVSLLEEAGELAKVGNVELGRARARARVVREMGREGFDQVVYPHTHHSNGKSVLLGILPEGDDTRKASVLLVSLAVLLCLLAFPILPEKETASAKLRTAEVENTGTLLGENSSGLEVPEKAPRVTSGGENTSAAMKITVPRLGLKDVAVPTGSKQAELDREGILRLRGSGLPWIAGSNTFITGHALGFPRTRVPYVFYKLNKMKPGDEIFVEDKEGQEYTFRVYDLMTVEPNDYWTTYPVEGKTVVSLQSCTPIPTFENRLIVRGELVS